MLSNQGTNKDILNTVKSTADTINTNVNTLKNAYAQKIYSKNYELLNTTTYNNYFKIFVPTYVYMEILVKDGIAISHRGAIFERRSELLKYNHTYGSNDDSYVIDTTSNLYFHLIGNFILEPGSYSVTPKAFLGDYPNLTDIPNALARCRITVKDFVTD